MDPGHPISPHPRSLFLPSMMSLLAPTASPVTLQTCCWLILAALLCKCSWQKILTPETGQKVSWPSLSKGHLMTLKAAFVFPSPFSSQDLRPFCYDMSQRGPWEKMKLPAEQGPGHKGRECHARIIRDEPEKHRKVLNSILLFFIVSQHPQLYPIQSIKRNKHSHFCLLLSSAFYLMPLTGWTKRTRKSTRTRRSGWWHLQMLACKGTQQWGG